MQIYDNWYTPTSRSLGHRSYDLVHAYFVNDVPIKGIKQVKKLWLNYRQKLDMGASQQPHFTEDKA